MTDAWREKRAQTLDALLRLALACSVLLLGASPITPQPVAAMAVFAAAILLHGINLALLRSGRQRAAELLVSGGMWTLATVTSVVWGNMPPTPVFHCLAVLMAGLFVSPRAGFVLALASTTVLGAVAWVDDLGVLPLVEASTLLGWVAITTGLAFVATVTALAVRGLSAALSELASSRRELGLIVEQAPDGLVLLDESGIVRAFNPGAERITGYGEHEIVGRLWTDLDVLDGAALAPATAFFFEDLPAGRAAARHEVRIVHKDGHRVPVEAQVHLVAGTDGTRIHVTLRDLSDRHRAEQLERQLQDARRLDALGRLTGGIAHDFNNLLTVIRGSADLLRDAALPERERQLASEIEAAADRAADLTAQLLAFGRRQVLESTVVDLDGVVRELEPLVRRLVTERVEVRLALAGDLPRTRCDRGRLDQVLMNLVVNARDAMPDGGVLTLATRAVVVDDPPADGHPGPHVEVAVSDTGAGIPAAHRATVFEPFFTTKEGGTGLGLATVYGIVQQQGGHVLVESREGEGATFRVRLPVSEHERILVVEDEPVVRDLTRRILAAAGYEVVAVATVGAAWEALSGGGFSVVVTDVGLPDESGVILARRISDRWPGLPVLFVTGYAPDLDGDALGEHRALLRKPFLPADLRDAVRKLLR